MQAFLDGTDRVKSSLAGIETKQEEHFAGDAGVEDFVSDIALYRKTGRDYLIGALEMVAKVKRITTNLSKVTSIRRDQASAGDDNTVRKPRAVIRDLRLTTASAG